MTTSDAFIVTKKDDSYELVEREILDRYSIKADMDHEGSKQIKEDGWAYGDYLLEPKYSPDKLIDLLDLNTFHENCVDVIARDSSGLSYTFIPSDEENTAEFDNETVQDFLNNINPSINTLLYRRNYDKRAIGYGAIEVIREDTAESQVKTLSHIPAHTLRRHSDGIRVKQMVGTKEVWFFIYDTNYDENGDKFDVHADTGEIYPYNSLSASEKANELLWTMDYAPGTNYYGRPKIIAALSTILGDLSRSSYNTTFFRNYGMPAFAVTITGDFADYDVSPDDPEYDVTKTLKYKISQQLKQVIRNPHSAVTILVPSEGEEGNVEVNIQPLSVDTKEASFRLYRKDNRDEILQAHKVDPSRLGIYESGQLNGSNSQNLDNSYKVSTIAPLKAENEYDINRLLTREFGLTDWKFTINDLDPKDYQNDILVLEKLFNMACITPQQIIDVVGDKFGLKSTNENCYLDEYYLNGTPLEKVWTAENTVNFPDLTGLNDEIIDEAETYDEFEETTTVEDSFEDEQSTKSMASFTERIKKALQK